MVTTQPLTIEMGKHVGSAPVTATVEGSVGTPTAGLAQVSASVAWMLGAKATLSSIAPGRVGENVVDIRRKFQQYAFVPNTLVRGIHYRNWLLSHDPELGRVLALERTRVTFNDGYTVTDPAPGYLSIALLDADLAPTNLVKRQQLKQAVLDISLPYDASRLSFVPVSVQQINGTIEVMLSDGADQDMTVANILEALDALLNPLTWEQGRDVYVGQLYTVAQKVPGIDYVQRVTLQGRGADDQTYELMGWELPISGFRIPDVILL